MHVCLEPVDGAVEGERLDQQRDYDDVGEQRREPDHVAALVEAAPGRIAGSMSEWGLIKYAQYG